MATHVDVEYFVTQTPGAYLVHLEDDREIWIPKSVCEEVHREPMPKPQIGEGFKGWLLVHDWFARKESLI